MVRILNFLVCKTVKNMGIGTALLQHLFNKMMSCGIHYISLHVATDNIPAISLYKKLGFETTETVNGYYGGIKDAFLMLKELSTNK